MFLMHVLVQSLGYWCLCLLITYDRSQNSVPLRNIEPSIEPTSISTLKMRTRQNISHSDFYYSQQ